MGRVIPKGRLKEVREELVILEIARAEAGAEVAAGAMVAVAGVVVADIVLDDLSLESINNRPYSTRLNAKEDYSCL
jgi:hypothetical protein